MGFSWEFKRKKITYINYSAWGMVQSQHKINISCYNHHRHYYHHQHHWIRKAIFKASSWALNLLPVNFSLPCPIYYTKINQLVINSKGHSYYPGCESSHRAWWMGQIKSVLTKFYQKLNRTEMQKDIMWDEGKESHSPALWFPRCWNDVEMK